MCSLGHCSVVPELQSKVALSNWNAGAREASFTWVAWDARGENFRFGGFLGIFNEVNDFVIFEVELVQLAFKTLGHTSWYRKYR